MKSIIVACVLMFSNLAWSCSGTILDISGPVELVAIDGRHPVPSSMGCGRHQVYLRVTCDHKEKQKVTLRYLDSRGMRQESSWTVNQCVSPYKNSDQILGSFTI